MRFHPEEAPRRRGGNDRSMAMWRNSQPAPRVGSRCRSPVARWPVRTMARPFSSLHLSRTPLPRRASFLRSKGRRSPGCARSERQMGGGGQRAASLSAWRQSRRETEALESLAARAIWKAGSLRRRSARTRATRKGWRVRGGRFGARRTIGKAGGALGAEAGQPLAGAALGEAEARRHHRAGLVKIDDARDHLRSTPRGEFGLIGRVPAAVVLGSVLISQPHLPKSSPHE